MRLPIILFFIVTFCLLTGCKEQPVYAKKVQIDGAWTYAKSLVFDFDIQDLEQTYDLILALEYGVDFDYQNVYVKITTIYPNQEKIEDILSLNLTNGSGLFLGDCGSSTCTIDLMLQEKFKFTKKGNYTITIDQYGREAALDKIYTAELKLYEVSNEK